MRAEDERAKQRIAGFAALEAFALPFGGPVPKSFLLGEFFFRRKPAKIESKQDPSPED